MFGSRSKKSEPVAAIKTSTSSKSSTNSGTTVIAKCIKAKGDIEGCGSIQVDGIIHGNITVEESIVIGESGIVYGNIKSKNITVAGVLEGSIYCDTLVVKQSGVVSDKVDVKEIISDGLIEAVVLAEDSIHITDNGKVETEQLQSKNITVNGLINGNVIASELLEINKNGKVKGKMVVKKIKVTEGGLMLGTMLTYEASDAIPSSRTEVAQDPIKESAPREVSDIPKSSDSKADSKKATISKNAPSAVKANSVKEVDDIIK